MSLKLITDVFNDTTLKPTQKLIMIALADNANDEGICYPLLKSVCLKTSLSERAVINNITDLEEKGYLTKRIRSRKYGGRYSNIYLLFPKENINKMDSQYERYFSKESIQTEPRAGIQTEPRAGIQTEPRAPKLTIVEQSLINRNAEESFSEEIEEQVFTKLSSDQKIQVLQSKLNKHIGIVKTKIFRDDQLSAKELVDQIEDPNDFISAYVEHKKSLKDKKYLKGMFAFMAEYVDGTMKSAKKLEDDYACVIHPTWTKLDDGNFATISSIVIDPFTGDVIPEYWEKKARQCVRT